jgi:hypothetical protein
MKNFKLFLSVVFVMLLFNSCENDDGLFLKNSSPSDQSLNPDIKNLGPNNEAELNNEDEFVNVSPTLVFGRYYGKCQGNACIEIFKLYKSRLLEDTVDKYPGSGTFYQGKFVNFKGSDRIKTSDLLPSFPLELLDSKIITYGTPDAGDWGGIYLEYQDGLHHRYWFLDLHPENIPKNLRAYVALIDETITEIGEINNQN